IVRAINEHGNYQPSAGDSVSVAVEDPNNASVFAKELPLSARGTFSGELEISAEGPLGNYSILAETEDRGSFSGSFQVAEYKKPEYKVKVSAANKFLPVGEKTSFTIDAHYFFGAPVANAEVKYYIYRSRYYVWAYGEDESDDSSDTSDEEESSEYYGYSNDLVKESEGKLDSH